MSTGAEQDINNEVQVKDPKILSKDPNSKPLIDHLLQACVLGWVFQGQWGESRRNLTVPANGAKTPEEWKGV
jgi:hypothetical protein